jgi:thiol-disulfide isomerase/thioredoxin
VTPSTSPNPTKQNSVLCVMVGSSASWARTALLMVACAGLATARPLVRNVKTDDEFRKLLKHHAEVRAAAVGARDARGSARPACARRYAKPACTRARQSAAGCALLTLCRPQVTGLPVIVDFYSDGCGPCRQVSGQGVRSAAGHLKMRLCCRGGPCGRAFVFVDSVRARDRWRPSTSRWQSSTRTRPCLPRSTSTPTTKLLPRSRSGVFCPK